MVFLPYTIDKELLSFATKDRIPEMCFPVCLVLHYRVKKNTL